jgi:hypothetical protein
VNQPTPPYDIGDLWVQGASGDIMRCQTPKATGSYQVSDWVKASKYTDDTAVNNLQIGGRNLLKGSSTGTGWSCTTFDAATHTFTRDNATATENYISCDNRFDLEAGKKYTLSFKAKHSLDQCKDMDIFILPPNYPTTGIAWYYSITDVSTEYKPYAITFTPPSSALDLTLCQLRFDNNGPSTVGTNHCLSLCDIKLEKGDKATDWTPAPEDTYEEITSLAKDIQTQLDQKAETWYQSTDPSTGWKTDEQKKLHIGDLWHCTAAIMNGNTVVRGKNTEWIWQQVGTSYQWAPMDVPDAVFDAIRGVASIYTTIPAKPIKGDLLIPATDLSGGYKAGKVYRYNGSTWNEINYTDDTAVNNLQIGGRNLAYSKAITHTGVTVNSTVTDNNTTKCWNITKNAAYSGTKISQDILVSGETYTLSYFFKGTAGTLKNIGGHCADFTFSKIILDGTQVSLDSYGNGIPLDENGTNKPFKEHYITLTFTVNPTQIDDENIYIQPNRGHDISITYDLWNIKLEQGNKATSWTPAPEDMVATNKIIEAINNTTETAKITAKHINLTGAVTFQDLDTATADTINNGVAGSVVEYALSDSPTVAPTLGWNTTAPAWQSGKYMWQKTTVTFNNTNKSPVVTTTCIQGAKGTDGKSLRQITRVMRAYDYATVQGWVGSESDVWSGVEIDDFNVGDTCLIAVSITDRDGAIGYMRCEILGYDSSSKNLTTRNIDFMLGPQGGTGKSVTGVVPQYCISTSNTKEPTTGWNEDFDAILDDYYDKRKANSSTSYYIWYRDKVTYDSGDPTYSTATVNSASSFIASWCDVNDKTKIHGSNIATHTITAAQISTDALHSNNYNSGTTDSLIPSGGYSKTGSFFDLSSGAIYAPHFHVDTNGKINANGGSIGGWTLGQITGKKDGSNSTLALHSGLEHDTTNHENRYVPKNGEGAVILSPQGYYFSSTGTPVLNGAGGQKWVFLAGTANSNHQVPFGITSTGNLYASSGRIAGWVIVASDSTFDNNSVIRTSKGVQGTYSYSTTGTDKTDIPGYVFTVLTPEGIRYVIKATSSYSSATLAIVNSLTHSGKFKVASSDDDTGVEYI